MAYFEAEGIIGAFCYRAALINKYKVTFRELTCFNHVFLSKCDEIERCYCELTRDDVIEFCKENSDILTFDRATDSIYIKQDLNAVVISLYGYSMYVDGTGAQPEFNETFKSLFMTEDY